MAVGETLGGIRMGQIKTGALIRTLRTEQGFTRRLRKSSVAAIRRCRNGNAAAARPMEHGHPISFPAGDTLPLKRLHKKKRRGNVAFLEEMKRKTTAGQPSEKRRSAACRAYYMKNGRFTCEPSVLCSAFVIPAEAGKSSCPENDFLLLLFLKKGGRFPFLQKRNKRRSGA